MKLWEATIGDTAIRASYMFVQISDKLGELKVNQVTMMPPWSGHGLNGLRPGNQQCQ